MTCIRRQYRRIPYTKDERVKVNHSYNIVFVARFEFDAVPRDLHL